MKKRERRSSSEKAMIALEALKGELTIAQISSKYQVDPTLVSRWKKELLEGAEQVFKKVKDKDIEEKNEVIEKLYKQVGKLTVQCDFLKEKLFP